MNLKDELTRTENLKDKISFLGGVLNNLNVSKGGSSFNDITSIIGETEFLFLEELLRIAVSKFTSKFENIMVSDVIKNEPNKIFTLSLNLKFRPRIVFLKLSINDFQYYIKIQSHEISKEFDLNDNNVSFSFKIVNLNNEEFRIKFTNTSDSNIKVSFIEMFCIE